MSDEKIVPNTSTKPVTMGRSLITEAQRADTATAHAIRSLETTVHGHVSQTASDRQWAEIAQVRALRGIRSALWALVGLAAAASVAFVTFVVSVIW